MSNAPARVFRALLVAAPCAAALVAGTTPVSAHAARVSPTSGTPCTRLVALTFDDGPDNTRATATPAAGTDAVLSALASRQVRATFFMIGRKVDAWPATARAVTDAGHIPGNHTYGHVDLTTLTSTQVQAEVSADQKAIHNATGHNPTLARPPFGYTNATVDGVYSSMGLARTLWAVDPKDWDSAATPDGVRSAVVTGVEQRDAQLKQNGSNEGVIVLMHDTGVATAAAVPGIIDDLRAQGFCFGKVAPSTTYSSTNWSYATVKAW